MPRRHQSMVHSHKRLLDDFHESYLSNFGFNVKQNSFVHRPSSLLRGQFYYESNIALRNIHHVEGFDFFGIPNKTLTLNSSFDYIPPMAIYFVVLQKILAYQVISEKINTALDEDKIVDMDKFLQSCFVIDVPHFLPNRKGKITKFRQEIKIKSYDENFNIRSKSILGTYCPDRVFNSYNMYDLRDIRGKFYNYYADFDETVFTDLNRDLANCLKEKITPDGLFSELEYFILESLALGNTAKEIASDELFRLKFNLSLHSVNKACSSILEKCTLNILPNFPGVVLHSAKDCAIFLEKIACL